MTACLLALASVPDGCDLRCGDKHCLLGWGDGVYEAHVNASWAVQDDEVEPQRLQCFAQLYHMCTCDVEPAGRHG